MSKLSVEPSKDADQTLPAVPGPNTIASLVDVLMGERDADGTTVEAPVATFTLRSGVTLKGRPALWRGHKLLLIVTAETITALDIDDVTALSVPASAPQAAVFLSAGATGVLAEEEDQRDSAALAALLERTKVLTARFGAKFKIDPDLQRDPATLVGMDALLDEVSQALSDMVEHKPGAFANAVDDVWLGRGGRAGVFLSQRRLEVRGRLEDGKSGRLEKEALQKAIEAVL